MALGYENAPISQIVSLSVLVLGLFFGSPDNTSSSILSSGSNILRFLGRQLVFENMAQTIVGVMLLYTFRQFERQMGSRKYGVFVLLSVTSTVASELIFAAIAQSGNIRFLPASGPYSIIFSSLVMFYTRVPKVMTGDYQYHVLGMAVSEKSWIYLLTAQLLFGAGVRSLIPAFAGSAFGYLYDRNLFRLQSIRFPRAVESALSLVGGFIVSLIPSGASSFFSGDARRGTGTGGQQRFRPPAGTGPGAQRFGAGAGTGAGPDGAGQGRGFVASPPSEENIATLMGMGFDRAAVLQALQATDNNVEAAANMLLR